MSERAVLALLAVLAALPTAALIVGRAPQPASRRSPGRFFLLYSALYSGLTLLTRFLGLDIAWLATGIALGLLGTGKGVRPLYRLLYGAGWVRDHPEAPAADVQRWHLPAMVGAVACIAAALFVAFLPR